MEKLTINCDGGSRGNPGPAASAFVVSSNGVEVHHESKYLGVTTNNVAEYSAVIMALDWLIKSSNQYPVTSIQFVLDSELIVRQINGKYKVKDLKLKELYAHVVQLLKKIKSKIIFENVSREKNQIADGMVNKELDKLS